MLQNTSKNVSMFEMFEMSANLCLLNAVTTSFRERHCPSLLSWGISRRQNDENIHHHDFHTLPPGPGCMISLRLTSICPRLWNISLCRLWRRKEACKLDITCLDLTVTRLVTFLTCDTCYITEGGGGDRRRILKIWEGWSAVSYCCQRVIKNN